MFRGRHLSKVTLDHLRHDVWAAGGIVDVRWTICVNVTLNDFSDGTTRNKLKRAMSDPERLRPEETW